MVARFCSASGTERDKSACVQQWAVSARPAVVNCCLLPITTGAIVTFSEGKLLVLKHHPQTEFSAFQNLCNLLSVSLAVKVLTVKVYNAK